MRCLRVASVLLLDGAARSLSAGTHVNQRTGLPTMVDVSAKIPTHRTATAISSVALPPSVVKSILLAAAPLKSRQKKLKKAPGVITGIKEIQSLKKGPVFATAVVAGTNAVKHTFSIIPFCHQLPIERCLFSFTFQRTPVVLSEQKKLKKLRKTTKTRKWWAVNIECSVSTFGKTGVEMEALTGASVAALTVYDMLKGIPMAQQSGLHIGPSVVLEKKGGKSDIGGGLRSAGKKKVAAPKDENESSSSSSSSSSSEDEALKVRAGKRSR